MHLTIIAKAPVPGRVKTRLCPPCTFEQAAELAAAALADTLDAVLAVSAGWPVQRVLLVDGDAPSWTPAGFEVVSQCSGTLADRLAGGFSRLGPGTIVGMETPHAVRSLRRAMRAVAQGEDAFGPAVDGGYWAIGVGRVDARIFDGIEMSTSRTGAQQLARLHSLGRSVTMLPEARDIDDFDDVRALAATGGWGRAVQTARSLVDQIDGGRAVSPDRRRVVA